MKSFLRLSQKRKRMGGEKKHEPRKKRKTFEKKQPTYFYRRPRFIEAKYSCSEENYSACAELAVAHFNITKRSFMRVLGDVCGCSFHRGSSHWHHINIKAAITEDERRLRSFLLRSAHMMGNIM